MSDPLATVLTTLLCCAILIGIGWQLRAFWHDERERRAERERIAAQHRQHLRVHGTLADHQKLRGRRVHTLKDLEQWMEDDR